MLLASALIALAGSRLSLYFLSKVHRDGSSAQSIWIVWSALICSASLWASHVFAISARSIQSQTGFQLEIALLSLGMAIFGVSLSFFLSVRRHIRMAQEFGGIVFGITIALMSGGLFWSFQIAGVTRHPMDFGIWAVISGILIGVAAVHFAVRQQTPLTTWLATFLMALGGMAVYGASKTLPQPAVPLFFPPSSHFMTDWQMMIIAALVVGTTAALALSGNLLNKHQKAASRRAYQHLALQDSLTHLPNRQYVNRIASRLLEQAGQEQNCCAVVLVALDEFKTINDLHGYETGDAVLCTMADLFRKHLPDQAIISRFYGDEFLIINPKLETADDAIEFARQVRALARRSVQLKKYRLSVRSSIGLAIFPQDGQNLNQLVQRANLAAKQAKSIGGNIIQPYVMGMEENNRWEATLAADLKNAALENQLSLVFQRQNLVSNGQLVGLEALVRWRHSEKGPIPPEDFIPIAERSGIILDIGNWVLKTACLEAAQWVDPVTLSVNASPLQFSRSDFSGLVSAVLMETGLPAERLEIELTESTPIEDHERVMETIVTLRKMGVRVAIDDFGTGYSSLNTLQAFPFDKIKVDRVFIQSLETNPHSRAILRSAILLGHSFGIPVIAEGVETENQLKFLKETGCREVQGFLFGKHLLPAQIKNISSQQLSDVI